MNDSARSYDDIPYPNLACPQSHPDRLATVAALFGLAAPPVTSCRVLEIGCAAGGNLLPMAATLPGSRFTGLDISPAQIASARECSDALALTNVTLETGSFAGFQAGSFDYIIAHGVYSWVESPLQAELLALCSRLLSPNGVAYVSYNTWPGSGMRHAMWQLTRLYACGTAIPGDQITKARNLFGLIESAFAGRVDPYAQLVQAETGELRGLDDSYIAHEYLEAANRPCYFHEFATAAASHGLQYLGESELQSLGTAGLPPAAADSLRRTARDLIEAEQFLDFVRHRSFRQTLLCRAGVELKRSIAPGVMEPFYIASSAQPAGTGLPGAEPAEFRGRDGTGIMVSDPLTCAALLELADAWPLPILFSELAERAAARARLTSDTGLRRTLALQLLNHCARSSAIELHLLPPPFQTAIPPCPEALPLARWQAQRSPRVVNGRHENLILGPAERGLLPLLDGTRTLEQLRSLAHDAPEILTRLSAASLLCRR